MILYSVCMLQVRVNMMSDFVYLSMINLSLPLFSSCYGDAMTVDKNAERNDEFQTEIWFVCRLVASWYVVIHMLYC